MKNSFEVSMNFFRKIQQFFMSDFLHSKFPKMRWICGMSRAVLFSRILWNKWKMKHAKFWKILCQILFRFWKNEERFWRGQCCVEKALKELLFWFDQISSWVQRKKATSEIVKCTKKFCVMKIKNRYFKTQWVPKWKSNPSTQF